MEQVTIDKNELYSLVKKAVREVLQEEFARLWLESMPTVSKEEMEDIERVHGKPSSGRDIVRTESTDV